MPQYFFVEEIIIVATSHSVVWRVIIWEPVESCIRVDPLY